MYRWEAWVSAQDFYWNWPQRMDQPRYWFLESLTAEKTKSRLRNLQADFDSSLMGGWMNGGRVVSRFRLCHFAGVDFNRSFRAGFTVNPATVVRAKAEPRVSRETAQGWGANIFNVVNKRQIIQLLDDHPEIWIQLLKLGVDWNFNCFSFTKLISDRAWQQRPTGWPSTRCPLQLWYCWTESHRRCQTMEARCQSFQKCSNICGSLTQDGYARSVWRRYWGDGLDAG